MRRRARQGFEHGFRAVTSASPSNAAAGTTADGDERLASILSAWGRLIGLAQAARLTTLGIAALALLDRLHTLSTPPASTAPVLLTGAPL